MNASLRLLVAVGAGLAAGAAVWCAAESMRPRSASNLLARRRSNLASGNALVVAVVAGLVVLMVTRRHPVPGRLGRSSPAGTLGSHRHVVAEVSRSTFGSREFTARCLGVRQLAVHRLA